MKDSIFDPRIEEAMLMLQKISDLYFQVEDSLDVSNLQQYAKPDDFQSGFESVFAALGAMATASAMDNIIKREVAKGKKAA